MGTNPMQKMKRNSILTGLLIGLIIGLILCAIVYLFLTSNAGKNITTSAKGETIAVQVLTKSVKSGGKINITDVTTKIVNKSEVPSDVTTIDKEVISKIDLSAGTVLTAGMLNTSSVALTKDLREQEYNMIVLPSGLKTGEFIDIRLQLPNGGDYIVISKKEVIDCNASTIWLNVNEEEIEVLSNAIIEYYTITGSKLYATIYTDPGIQEASIPTYCPNSEVVALISNNPNITSEVIDGQGRFTEKLKSIRTKNINTELNKYNDTGLENIETSLQEEIKTLKESRESYFGELDTVN